MKSPSWWYGLLAIPLLFLICFYLYPSLALFNLSFRPEDNFDSSAIDRLLSSSYYVQVTLYTAFQALLSTCLTLLLAIPGAYVFAHYTFPGKSILLALATVPFVLPTVVVAAAFQALLGPRGLVNDVLMNWFQLSAPPVMLERSLTLILIAHIFYNYSVALRLISTYWMNQSPRIDEAARILGAHSWRLWWYVRWPLLRPAIITSGLLIFIFTFTSFGVVLILGGLQYATLEVQIYYQALSLFDLPVAATLSILQIGIMFIVMSIYTLSSRRITQEIQAGGMRLRIVSSWQSKLLVWGNVFFVFILTVAPVLALVGRAFVTRDGQLSMIYFHALFENPRGSISFVPPWQAVGNSLAFALMTMVMATLLGLLSAYLIELRGRWGRVGRWFDVLVMLPLATSAVTLGLGYLISLDRPPLNLRSSWLIIPIAHTLVATPFVVRSLLPALRRLPDNIVEAGSVLGANPVQNWLHIQMPLIVRSVVVGALFAFTVSMGEFGASLFVARPDSPTIPVVLFRLLGQPGALNYGQAMALSVILVFVCCTAYILLHRWRTPGAGEF